MKVGDLVRLKQHCANGYFAGLAIITNIPSNALTGVLLHTVSGTEMFINKDNLEVVNESR